METEAQWRAMAAGVLQLDWRDAVVDFVTCDPTLGALENYIHEVSHAFLLGYKRIDSATSSRIGNKLDKLPEYKQIDQEAHTWAVEWRVWEALSLPLEWEDATAAAEIQRVSKDDIRSHLANPETKVVADKVVNHLRALAEKAVA